MFFKNIWANFEKNCTCLELSKIMQQTEEYIEFIPNKIALKLRLLALICS